MNISDEDFGFSLTTVTEIKKAAEIKNGDSLNAINNLLLASRKDLDTLYAMFKPFLDNLSSDPSKDVIQWDGKKRVEQISQFKMKVEKFIENSKRRGV